MENSHAVPILGGQKPHVSPSAVSFVRNLDENGTFEAMGVVQGQDGNATAMIQRQDYLDATELLNAIRLIVREEIAKAVTSQRMNRSLRRRQ